MRYGYHQRLGPRQRAIYRKSDATSGVPLPDPDAHAPLATAIEDALQTGDRIVVGRSARGLVRALCRSLRTSAPTVRVLSRRPSDDTAELHGLYEREEDGRAVIRVWMRTAVSKQVVAYRTFMRTLLHELCHHLDYELLALEDSFHTRGFFQRESSLMRQLAPKPPSDRRPADLNDAASPGTSQLPLPGVQP